MLKRFLFRLNEKEKKYQRSPCTTREIFPGLSNLSSDAALLSSNELKSSEVLSVNRQNRFIEISPHYHDFLEIQYIYSGNCTQIINDKEIHLKEGDICIVDTGTVHSIKAAGINDIFVNIMLRKDYYSSGLLNRLSSGSVIAEFLVNSISSRHQRQNHLLFHPLDTSKIHFFLEALLCEYYDKQLSSFEVTECYLVLFFSELLRSAQYTENPSPATGTAGKELIYILKYIESNYQTCTLKSLAKQFGFHPTYLSSFLHKYTGQTFKEIIHTQRMKQASLLLKKTPLAVYEIAEQIGYSNLTYFYKKFEEYYGVSPQTYRNST